jgi:hypothetical protein
VFKEPTKYIPFGEKEEKRILERLIDKSKSMTPSSFTLTTALGLRIERI